MMPEDLQLQVSPGPHLWRGFSVTKIMLILLLALLLPAAAAIYFYGFYALSVMAWCILFAVITEMAVKRIRHRPFVMDGSAIVTGILLALTLPPGIPLWMAAVGAIFAIAIVKEAFGGLGHNIFNPALGGRAFLGACFALEMTSWVKPTGFAADAITTATPLGEGFAMPASRGSLYLDMFLGNTGGSLGETSALLILLGGVILVAVNIIDFKVPLVYLATVALLSLVTGQDIMVQLLAGGLMLGAVFMATDPVTSPLTASGRIIFAVGCGVLTVIIRHFGGLPEGVTYSILFMNALTPLIDRYVKVRPYGLRKAVKSEA
jgi:electron transport complex protein RnfD